MTAFPEVETIRYEGPDAKNPLAFRWYNADEVVEGVTMQDHLRFSVVYWHTFRGTGSDPFGPGTHGAALGRWFASRWRTPSGGSTWHSNSWKSWAPPITRFTTAMSRPKVRVWPKPIAISIRWCRS